MTSITLTPPSRPFRKTVRVPGSKSITNRALILAALAHGPSTLTNALFADDTRHMIHALQSLGYQLHIDEPASTISLTGRGPHIPAASADLHCGNSGTTLRFLTALLTLARAENGVYVLDGVPRMRERPIDQLVNQLRALGACIDYPAASGFPPVRVYAAGLKGGTCTFQDAKSSQYISAILMAAPYALAPVTIQLVGPITSEPYVHMTLRMMQQFGYDGATGKTSPGVAELSTVYTIPPGAYHPQTCAIEPDASNASYFLAAAALHPGSSITIEGLGKGSLQGDIAFADLLHQMGANLIFGPDFVTITGPDALTGIDIDMNHIPDMVQTLAVTALFARGTTTIRNVPNLRLKETDRLAALQTELAKFGAQVSATADSITITPPVPAALHAPTADIQTYDDHRMAMSFALAALRIPHTTIQDPDCTSKTYPTFFPDLIAAVS